METEAVKNFRPLLEECFAKDSDLLSTWHIFSGRGLEACVEKTFEDLKKTAAVVFRVKRDSKTVGYFGREAAGDWSFLTGFFVMPENRNKSDVGEFWRLIAKEFKRPFMCGLYKKNKPAIGFIEKNHGKPFLEMALPDGDAVFYKVEV